MRTADLMRPGPVPDGPAALADDSGPVLEFRATVGSPAPVERPCALFVGTRCRERAIVRIEDTTSGDRGWGCPDHAVEAIKATLGGVRVVDVDLPGHGDVVPRVAAQLHRLAGYPLSNDDRPPAADPRLRALLDQVQATYDQIARQPSEANSVQLPVRAPAVPAELVERIHEARTLAIAMLPSLEQVCTTYADAVHLAGAFYDEGIADDQPCDQFMKAIGAAELADALYKLTGWLPL